jgi:hypothetical protein
MSFIIDKTVTDKPPKKTVVSQFTGNNSILGTLRIRLIKLTENYPAQCVTAGST